MTDTTDQKMSGGASSSVGDPSLSKPQPEGVEMKALQSGEVSKPDGAEPSPVPPPPAKDDATVSGPSAAVRSPSPKGKDKEGEPAAAQDGAGRNSLSIQPDGAGADGGSASSAASPPAISEDMAGGTPEGDAAAMEGVADSTVCSITLLLGSGARHPYRLDERYLAKRGVALTGLTESGKKDPFSISVYTLKELILREWRDEWESRPSSPSSIRLIYFGKLLDDKLKLHGNVDTLPREMRVVFCIPWALELTGSLFA